MSDADAQVAELKQRISAAQSKRARAEAEARVAAEALARSAREIKEEFGIEPDQVPAKIQELEADLTAAVRRVREQLAKAEEKS